VREIVAGEKLLRRIEWTSAILLAVLSIAAWALFSIRDGIGVLLGGGIVIMSFQVLKWQLRKAFLSPGALPSKGGLFASYYLRFLGTLFLVFVVFHYGWADPIAFLVGLSVVVLGIVLVGGLEFLVLLARKGES